MEHEPSHKKVVKRLIRDIYARKLKPGEKLPPLRELSRELATDQTSLRIALKHLEMMRVVVIKRSDGAYIQDYLENAGPEFLIALLPAPGAQEPLIDEYLIDELFEYWKAFLPELVRMSWGRLSLKNIKEIMTIYDQELEALPDISTIVTLEIRLVNTLVKVADNIMLTLMTNSLRPMQQQMTEVMMRVLSPEVLRESILQRKELMEGIISGGITDPDAGIEKLRQIMEFNQQNMRKALAEKVAHKKRPAPLASE